MSAFDATFVLVLLAVGSSIVIGNFSNLKVDKANGMISWYFEEAITQGSEEDYNDVEFNVTITRGSERWETSTTMKKVYISGMKAGTYDIYLKSGEYTASEHAVQLSDTSQSISPFDLYFDNEGVLVWQPPFPIADLTPEAKEMWQGGDNPGVYTVKVIQTKQTYSTTSTIVYISRLNPQEDHEIAVYCEPNQSHNLRPHLIKETTLKLTEDDQYLLHWPGYFTIEPSLYKPSDVTNVYYAEWKPVGLEWKCIGSVNPAVTPSIPIIGLVERTHYLVELSNEKPVSTIPNQTSVVHFYSVSGTELEVDRIRVSQVRKNIYFRGQKNAEISVWQQSSVGHWEMLPPTVIKRGFREQYTVKISKDYATVVVRQTNKEEQFESVPTVIKLADVTLPALAAPLHGIQGASHSLQHPGAASAHSFSHRTAQHQRRIPVPGSHKKRYPGVMGMKPSAMVKEVTNRWKVEEASNPGLILNHLNSDAFKRAFQFLSEAIGKLNENTENGVSEFELLVQAAHDSFDAHSRRIKAMFSPLPHNPSSMIKIHNRITFSSGLGVDGEMAVHDIEQLKGYIMDFTSDVVVWDYDPSNIHYLTTLPFEEVDKAIREHQPLSEMRRLFLHMAIRSFNDLEKKNQETASETLQPSNLIEFPQLVRTEPEIRRRNMKFTQIRKGWMKFTLPETSNTVERTYAILFQTPTPSPEFEKRLDKFNQARAANGSGSSLSVAPTHP